MIFGFNTDIKVGTTVFHVQSEARRAEEVLQTQVFVQGRCIGKHEASYAGKSSDDDFLHGLLRAQHKWAVEAVRSGKVDEVLKSDEVEPSVVAAKDAESSHSAAEPPAVPQVQHLQVEFISSRRPAVNVLLVKFRVMEDSEPIMGALVVGRLVHEGDENGVSSPETHAISNADGMLELKVELPQQRTGVIRLAIRATHAGNDLSTRFKLKF